jgi:hypothetical protein
VRERKVRGLRPDRRPRPPPSWSTHVPFLRRLAYPATSAPRARGDVDKVESSGTGCNDAPRSGLRGTWTARDHHRAARLLCTVCPGRSCRLSACAFTVALRPGVATGSPDGTGTSGPVVLVSGSGLRTGGGELPRSPRCTGGRPCWRVAKPPKPSAGSARRQLAGHVAATRHVRAGSTDVLLPPARRRPPDRPRFRAVASRTTSMILPAATRAASHGRCG